MKTTILSITAVIILWHIAVYVYNYKKHSPFEANRSAKKRWLDVWGLIKELGLLVVGVIVFTTVSILGFIYTTFKHLIKGDYSLSRQLTPIVRSFTLANDGFANASAGELLNDTNDVAPKDELASVRYGKWYETISAVTGLLARRLRALKLRKILDSVLGKNHCEEAINPQQNNYYSK